MFAKRLFHKAIHHHHRRKTSGGLTSADIDVRIITHYGIPSTASILAFDPFQRLLAIGTLDGRIKLVGGENIEGLLISPKQQPYKFLEFLQNQGYLISITNDNDIQVWNLRSRSIDSSFQCESNVTAFCIINGSSFMYVGDEQGLISVLKFESETGQLLRLPYHLSSGFLAEAEGPTFPTQPIVGVLPQPCSFGSRILIAYETGLIILWDVIESRIVTLRGDRFLQLNSEVDPPSDAEPSLEGDTPLNHLEVKEISAVCWASSDGSILSVGYVDGDILCWGILVATSKKIQQPELTSNVVKLQLTSAEKKLPIIALHWLQNDMSRHEGDGHLVIYGGNEIGGMEAVTVLALEWSSGKKNVKCVRRVDLKLRGNFADIILLPTSVTVGSNENPVLLVLSSPGNLQLFDSASFSSSVSHKENNSYGSAVDFPSVIPTTSPCMTVARLFCLPADNNLSKALTEIVAEKKNHSPSNIAAGVRKWSLTGGVLNHLILSEDRWIERLYVTGYQDGSVWIWDATYPVLSLLCVIDREEIKGLNISDSSTPVSEVDICFQTLTLAVGGESGLVFLYSLDNRNRSNFHFISENTDEVHCLPRNEGPACKAVLSILNSRIQALQFSNLGAKLIVGFECARIAVLDTKSFKTVFLTESLSSCTSPLVSLVLKEFWHGQGKSPKSLGTKILGEHVDEYIFILTDDARVCIVDGKSGNMISPHPIIHLRKQSAAISMHIIESSSLISEDVDKKSYNEDVVSDKSPRDINASQSTRSEAKKVTSENVSSVGAKDSYLLLCCKDAVYVFTLKSVIQGDDSKAISKIKLAKPCCWTTIIMKDDKIRGLLLLCQSGEIQIRSLPDLEMVKEFSVMSTLRLNFSPKMEKFISSSTHGHMVQGSEVAFISVLARENYYRIPQSLPSLHDEVLASASKASLNVSWDHKKKQGSGSGILGGIVKGLKGGKSKNSSGCLSSLSHLESIFAINPFPEVIPTSTHEQEDADLNIDDIEIDEPVAHASTSSHSVQNNQREVRSEREKLFEGGTDAKPRVRTREEIIATYRKATDASTVAGQARNKLIERQKKLEKISKRTEELQSGAEDFATLANELVKEMEKRKWWQI